MASKKYSMYLESDVKLPFQLQTTKIDIREVYGEQSTKSCCLNDARSSYTWRFWTLNQNCVILNSGDWQYSCTNDYWKRQTVQTAKQKWFPSSKNKWIYTFKSALVDRMPRQDATSIQCRPWLRPLLASKVWTPLRSMKTFPFGKLKLEKNQLYQNHLQLAKSPPQLYKNVSGLTNTIGLISANCHFNTSSSQVAIFVSVSWSQYRSVL